MQNLRRFLRYFLILNSDSNLNEQLSISLIQHIIRLNNILALFHLSGLVSSAYNFNNKTNSLWSQFNEIPK